MQSLYTEFSRNFGSQAFLGIVLEVLWGNNFERIAVIQTRFWEQNNPFWSYNVITVLLHRLFTEADIRIFFFSAQYMSRKATQKINSSDFKVIP